MATENVKSRDLTQGKLLPKIILFSLPLMATGILQMAFNAADVVVVGRWGGSTPEECENALAAVGSCAALINLIVNFFIGLSVGSSVCAAQSIGAKHYDKVQQVVHTSILTALVAGILLAIAGMGLSRPLLALMGTPAEILDQASLYMCAYFAGAPASMIYNYAASILRSDGDTKNPLIFLSIAGVVNVLFNLVMVLVFHMGAIGVGIATAASQWVSCILVILHMMRQEGYCRLELRRLRIHRHTFYKMLLIGIPAGIQGMVFSFSNVLVQSSINRFGKVVVAAYTACNNICNFIYMAQNSFYHAALTFVGQNVGAHRYERIRRVILLCIACALVVGLTLGIGCAVFAKPLLGIYMPDNTEGLHYGTVFLSCVASTYFLCGVMEVGCGLLRGLGKSFTSTVTSILGACGVRVVWLLSVFAYFFPILPYEQSLFILGLSYPISWTITAVAYFILAAIALKKRKASDTAFLEAECTDAFAESK